MIQKFFVLLTSLAVVLAWASPLNINVMDEQSSSGADLMPKLIRQVVYQLPERTKGLEATLNILLSCGLTVSHIYSGPMPKDALALARKLAPYLNRKCAAKGSPITELFARSEQLAQASAIPTAHIYVGDCVFGGGNDPAPAGVLEAIAARLAQSPKTKVMWIAGCRTLKTTTDWRAAMVQRLLVLQKAGKLVDSSEVDVTEKWPEFERLWR